MKRNLRNVVAERERCRLAQLRAHKHRQARRSIHHPGPYPAGAARRQPAMTGHSKPAPGPATEVGQALPASQVRKETTTMTQTVTAAPKGDHGQTIADLCPPGFEPLAQACAAAGATPGQFALEAMAVQKVAGGFGGLDAEAISKAADDYTWRHSAAVRTEYLNKAAFLAYRAGRRAGRISGGRG